jgi:hypothetical protein
VLNGRVYKDSQHKNFIFHAFSYGLVKNRTIDMAYYDIFNLEKPKEDIDLTELAANYYTDKQYEHNYFSLVYTDLFSSIKDDVKSFVEIGMDKGESLLLWRDYFTEANIIGADIDISRARDALNNKNNDRIALVTLDQSKEDMLEEFTRDNSNIDIILDDGSHKMRDQQITFAKLFKSLKSGGLYIIEDLHTSLEAKIPEKYIFNWGNPENTLTLDMLKDFKKTGVLTSDYMSQEDLKYLNDNIKSVEVYQSRPDWSITSVIVKK